jgi:hypothetical protein
MFIVPYTKKGNILWVFMKDGALWKTDEKNLTAKKIVELYLEPNGFLGRMVCVKGAPSDYAYFEIDERTNMGDFYMWDEILEKGGELADVWRPFFALEDCKEMYPEYIQFLKMAV